MLNYKTIEQKKSNKIFGTFLGSKLEIKYFPLFFLILSTPYYLDL